MHRKGSVAIVVLMVVIIILAIGGLWWYYVHQSSQSPAIAPIENVTSTSSNSAAPSSTESATSSIQQAQTVASTSETTVSVGPISSWSYAKYPGGISFRYPKSWSDLYLANAENGQGPADAEPSGTVFFDQISSPPINLPAFPQPAYSYNDYVLTILSTGPNQYEAYGQFQGGYRNFGCCGANAPVTNNFIENSSEYAIAKMIVSTFSNPIQFIEVPADQNGQSVLMSETGITFPTPILYPSSWATDCLYSDPQAAGAGGALYCQLMNEPADLNDDTPPANFCALQWYSYTTSTEINTYTDASSKQNCEQQLNVIQGEFFKDSSSIQNQLCLGDPACLGGVN
jgi:hypothetical protein